MIVQQLNANLSFRKYKFYGQTKVQILQQILQLLKYILMVPVPKRTLPAAWYNPRRHPTTACTLKLLCDPVEEECAPPLFHCHRLF